MEKAAPAGGRLLYFGHDDDRPPDAIPKQRLYAAAGIPLCVIVNLVDRVVERYSVPDVATGRYATRQVVRRDETLEIVLGAGFALNVPAAELLP